LGDNFKVSLGYRINPHPWWGTWDPNTPDPTASKSSINGSFMVNGRLSDAIAFDLFYSIMGKDDDTFARPKDDGTLKLGPIIPNDSGIPYNGSPDVGQWGNTIGAYIGLNIVQNLGLSLGYTANFDVYETTAFLAAADVASNDWTKAKPRNYTAPFYSGVDLHVKFSGIDKIGLNFNNNFSFAGVKATKLEGDWDKAVLDFDGSIFALGTGDDSNTRDWFHWNAELKASLSLVENLGLTVHLGNQLSVRSGEYKYTGGSDKGTLTDNEFRVSVFADYGIGAVNVGLGLDFGVKSHLVDTESTSGGSTTTTKSNADVTYFGIPILFRVAF